MTAIPEGIYSETKVQTIGTMSTSRTQTIVDYYMCIQVDNDTVSAQILDIYGEVMPLVVKVPMGEFLKRFTYDPDKFLNKKTPAEMSIAKAIDTAEKYIARKEYNCAEYEYFKALKLDEENVRASFGLGKLYLAIGDTQKAGQVFSRLAKQNNMLDVKNKYVFNELAIELRNLTLYAQAIDFYRRSLALSPDDEHLLFNIARAFAEDGNKDVAHDYLNQALAINPGMEVAQKFKNTL